MSADFSTFIRLKGTNNEILAILNVIKTYEIEKYEQYITRHDCEYFNSIYVNGKNKPFSSNGKFLKTASEEELKEFIQSHKNIYVFASGPWGIFGSLDELSLFEEMAEAAPNSNFVGRISGFDAGGSQEAEAELRAGLLYLRYSFSDDEDCDDEYDEDDSEWDVEYIYNPVTKKFIECNEYN